MKSYLESSIFYKIYMHMLILYKLSKLKSVLDTLSIWKINSLVYKCIIRYWGKESKAKYTYSYRFLAFLGGKADKVIVKVHTLFSSVFKKSVIFSILNDFTVTCRTGINTFIFTLIVTFILGYNLVVVVRGSLSTAVLINDCVIAIVGFVMAFTITKWQIWIKSSLFYKLCKFLWE